MQLVHLFAMQLINATSRLSVILQIILHVEPYDVEYTGSSPITEVKQLRARGVANWMTELLIPKLDKYAIHVEHVFAARTLHKFIE